MTEKFLGGVPMKMGGCWIFLSHSGEDIEKVRIIRNEFERYTHNPLAFHLRCLSDETPEKKKELDDLIKREIDCREWFVFCESPAAARSDYVKMEKNYIREQNKANVWSIDLSLSEEEIRRCVKKICGQLTVFISYAAHDGNAVYHQLSEALIKKDYDVWDSDCLATANLFKMDHPIATEYGYAVILVTEAYAKSPYCLMELEQLCATNKRILPFRTPGAQIPFQLCAQRCYSIPTNPTVDEIQLIVNLIDALVESSLGGIVHSKDELQKTIGTLEHKLLHLCDS
jgi:hypothetical protein